MDADASGVMTQQELINGYRNNHDFRLAMKAMDIEEEDMNHVFRMLDEDQSGTVRYDEFAEQIWKMKSTDDHTLLLFLKFGLYEIKLQIDKEMIILKQEMAILKESHGNHSELVQN